MITTSQNMDNSSLDEPSYTGFHLVPAKNSAENIQEVDVYLPSQTQWEKVEGYLKIISVPLIIVAVVFVGFLLRFFSEIIIPIILALVLFQISKIIVLHIERPIIPYLAREVHISPNQQQALLRNGDESDVGFD